MNTTAVAERPTKIVDLSMLPTAGGANLMPTSFAEVAKLADIMSKTDVGIPKAFRERSGACLSVCMQALRWELEPFAVINKAYVVNDQVAYEAQLLAAIVHTRAGLKSLPKYAYSGTGEDMTCTVSAARRDGQVVDYTTPPIGRIRTKNSPLWKDDPQQQLGYFAIRSWARRYVPEVLMGIYTPDEAREMKDVTPPERQPSGKSALDAFAGMNDAPAIDNETGEIIDDNPEPDGEATAPAGGKPAGDERSSTSPAGDKEDRPPVTDEDIAAAREKGQNDRARGRSRKAVPGAYRDVPDLVAAWQEGFDGESGDDGEAELPI